MRANKNVTAIAAGAVILAAVIAAVFVLKHPHLAGNTPGEAREAKAAMGDIRIVVDTTGVVEPQNRLEIKPPIDGRVDSIEVREGDKVVQGQVLAWMSSTDRAALLDAAQTQGSDAVKYWKEVYRPTPLMSPIDGEVIVRAVEPGQTVTSATPVLVLSDRLIVKAQFDETDIGRIKLKQPAVISLDAYPGDKIAAVVGHIAYESKLINNVTIYEVDILPETIPSFFRSGMSANVSVAEKEKKDVLIIPAEAVTKKEGIDTVTVRSVAGLRTKAVETGMSDGVHTEISSGLKAGDVVVIQKKKYQSARKSATSPLVQQGKKKK